eukprot:gene6902-7596_t
MLIDTLKDIVVETREGFTTQYLDARPSLSFSLRSVEAETVRVYRLPEMRLIDEIGQRHAIFEIYEGAIFLHQGETYLVTYYNQDEFLAHVKRVSVKYFTKPRDFTNVDVIGTTMRDDSHVFAFGNVQVTTAVYGFHKISEHTFEILETVPLMLKHFEYQTRGCWIEVRQHIKDILVHLGMDLTSAVHAACHALKTTFSTIVLSASTDINCEHASPLQRRNRPLRLVLFDANSVGTGTCYVGARHMSQTALERIRTCVCQYGCPSCIHDFHCSEHNQRLCKQGAQLILQDIVSVISGQDYINKTTGAIVYCTRAATK